MSFFRTHGVVPQISNCSDLQVTLQSRQHLKILNVGYAVAFAKMADLIALIFRRDGACYVVWKLTKC